MPGQGHRLRAAAGVGQRGGAGRSGGDAELSTPSPRLLVTASIAILNGAAQASAQQPGATETPPGERWTVTVAPYLWLVSIDGHAAVGGIKSDVDVPVQDVLKDLSSGAMIVVDVEKGRFGIGVNGLFARVSPDSKVGDGKIDATSDSEQLTTLLVGYRALYQDYHHQNFEWDVTMHGPVIGTAVRF